MKIQIKYFIFVLIFIFSCENLLIDQDPKNTHASNLKTFWEDFDRNYPSFIVKNINWNSVYSQSLVKINKGLTDKNFYSLLSNIILNLKDGHLELSSPFGYTIYRDHSRPTENTIDNLEAYLSNYIIMNSSISYGDINSTNLGYIKISTFNNSLPIQYFLVIDDILEHFQSKKGIIIDIRSNSGGNLSYAKLIAKRFVKEPSVFVKMKFRNGESHNQFTDWIEDLIEPEGKFQYLKSIVILTNRRTMSSAEIFTFPFIGLSNVKIIGDTTLGAQGTTIWRELPNGWSYRMTISLAADKNEIIYEGKGIAPDITIWISKEDSTNGIDKILETAIDILN